ncbi:MAG: hypothetical protein HY547_00665 [Elusimicrobia bacterium]|nr:hypothetical protein [Elusimicrobiota bacterium]
MRNFRLRRWGIVPLPSRLRRFRVPQHCLRGCGTIPQGNPGRSPSELLRGRFRNCGIWVDTEGTIKWKDDDCISYPYSGANWSSPAIASDGTMYLGLTYGAFLAVRTDSPGLSISAPWPKFHHNNKNTGRQQ